MELTLLLLVISLVTLSLSLSVLLYKHRSNYNAPNLPPGKPGLPIIGEGLEFLSTGWKGQPEKFIFDRMSSYSSKVFKTHIFGEPGAVFCGATGNKFLFSNTTVWFPATVNKIFPSSKQTSSNEEGKKIRKLLPQYMKPEALQRYIGVMDSFAQTHFSSCWENKDEVIVFHLVKQFAFSIACRLFVSIEDPNEVAKIAKPFQLLHYGLISLPIDLPGTPINRAKKASNFIKKELLKIIKQRKVDLSEQNASPTQDILSHMLLTSDDDGKLMNEMDVADKILGLLVGGHETITSACTMIVKYLAELPHIYEGVYKEQIEIAESKAPGELLNWVDIQNMKYSWNVACEVLRLAPPIPGAFREAINDFVFNGFSIPKGWKLHWSTYSTHLNPEYFAEPEKFDPSRFERHGPAPYTFVPFGGGPRMCPGMEYARLEILVFMHHLVKRFKWEKLFPEEKIVVNPLPTPTKGLPIRLYPHKA